MAARGPPLHMVQTTDYSRLVPADVYPSGYQSVAELSALGRYEAGNFLDQSADPQRAAIGQVWQGAAPSANPARSNVQLEKDTIKIDMEIKFPKKEKKKKVVEKKSMGSLLSGIFTEQKFPEPMYFHNVDCVGLPELFTPKECRLIVDFAEAQGFSMQQRHRVLNLMWTDIVDPFFADAIWQMCGLSWFLRTITIDGMVPCGINDVIRIQKYVQGSMFGRHTDQQIKREDGRISKYSLRVFLNGRDDDEFEGGLSVFHVPFRQEPVVFEPEPGLALLYPQGQLCTVQEEAEVLFGNKYVLRADILFCKPGHHHARPGDR